jgi:hypothetical protein
MYNNDQPPNYYNYYNENQLNNINSNVSLPASTTINNGITPINAFNSNNVMNNGTNNMNGTPAYGQIVAQTQMQNQTEHKNVLLNQLYPVKFVIVHALITGAISVATIGLQVYMIINELFNNFYSGKKKTIYLYIFIFCF